MGAILVWITGLVRSPFCSWVNLSENITALSLHRSTYWLSQQSHFFFLKKVKNWYTLPKNPTVALYHYGHNWVFSTGKAFCSATGLDLADQAPNVLGMFSTKTIKRPHLERSHLTLILRPERLCPAKPAHLWAEMLATVREFRTTNGGENGTSRFDGGGVACGVLLIQDQY